MENNQIGLAIEQHSEWTFVDVTLWLLHEFKSATPDIWFYLSSFRSCLSASVSSETGTERSLYGSPLGTGQEEKEEKCLKYGRYFHL